MRHQSAQLFSLLAVIVGWGIVSAVIGTRVLPGPIQVGPALAHLLTSGEFLEPLVQSLGRTAVGFVVGFVVGVGIGIGAAKSPWFALTATPLLNVVLFAPTLVVIFLGVAILGTSLVSIAVITAIAVAPNVAIYMRDVMRDFDPELVDMSDSFRVPTAQRVRDLYLPYLVPAMLAAARIGFSMSWKVIMLSEVFGFPGGLGFKIRINYTVYDLTTLLAWLSIFVVALLLIEQLLRISERRLVPWRA
jgi:NitT/TauT family transport system permease protein